MRFKDRAHREVFFRYLEVPWAYQNTVAYQYSMWLVATGHGAYRLYHASYRLWPITPMASWGHGPMGYTAYGHGCLLPCAWAYGLCHGRWPIGMGRWPILQPLAYALQPWTYRR